jgi:hypothetical protein
LTVGTNPYKRKTDSLLYYKPPQDFDLGIRQLESRLFQDPDAAPNFTAILSRSRFFRRKQSYTKNTFARRGGAPTSIRAHRQGALRTGAGLIGRGEQTLPARFGSAYAPTSLSLSSLR